MKTIFLNLHFSSITGPIDYLRKYLLRQGCSVLYLAHPLDDYKNNYTYFYKNQFQVKKIKRLNLGLINLIFDVILSSKYIFFNKFDIYIGANNFDVFPAIFLRIFFKKRIKKIIYFATDFSEDRFKSPILNKIYYLTEKIVIKYADLVISNTKRSETKRVEYGLNLSKSLIIPNGLYLNKPSFKNKSIDKSSFIYIGSVTKEHGLYELLEKLKPIIKKFILIGDGNDWKRIIMYLKNNKINSEIYHKKNHEFVINYLQKFNGFGLAPYNIKSKWTYYCSPLKINEYIGCGCPVILSSVPEISQYIEKKKLGIVYKKLDLDDIKKKINLFNAKNYCQRSETFYQNHNYNFLYSKIDL